MDNKYLTWYYVLVFYNEFQPARKAKRTDIWPMTLDSHAWFSVLSTNAYLSHERTCHSAISLPSSWSIFLPFGYCKAIILIIDQSSDGFLVFVIHDNFLLQWFYTDIWCILHFKFDILVIFTKYSIRAVYSHTCHCSLC